MKIVHVEDYFDPTAGYQINELLLASKDLNDQVFLITSTDMSPFHKEIDIDKDMAFELETGVKIFRLEPVLKLSSRLILKNIKNIIEEIDPDAVFMHGIGDFKDLQLWRKKPRYKVIRDCHMSWVASKNKLSSLYFLFYRLFFASIINMTSKYSTIYALGQEEYEYLRKLGINKRKIDYLPHGYNDSIMYFDEIERKLTREMYNFKDNDIVISYIGKFDYKKRPDLIINIIDKFDEEYLKQNKIKVLFLGPKDETYMIDFNKKVESIKNKLQITIDESKPFKDLRKYYSASDICIFPKETTLSSIHAQVCGSPVIMENHKSNMERVVINDNLYKKNNLDDAFTILKRIIDNAEFKKKHNKSFMIINREYKRQISIFINNLSLDK
jgi:glycosyltransferase involved in cell wall biosynthesis